MKALLFLLFLQIVYYELIDEVEADDDDCKVKKAHLPLVRLKKDLLCSYEKSIIPKIDLANVTTVTVRMILKSFTYKAHSEEIKVDSWLTVTWKDDHLKWKPEEYEGVKRTLMSSDEIWVPDISIYNRADQTGAPDLISSVVCQVYYSGSVVVVAPMSESALCIPNLRKYPFDTQKCTLRIGSWVHSGEVLNLTAHRTAPVSKNDLAKNPSFEVIDVKVTRNPGKYACCPNNTYPSLRYIFTIRRYSSTIAAAYLIPAIILILLTLSTLWLNVDSMDRLCVCCANLIIHFLYIENIWWNLPSGGENTPLVIIYARDSLLLSGVAFILTILLRTMQGSTQNTPTWICSFVSMVIGSRPGKVLFFFDVNDKTVAAARCEEDAVKMVENAENSRGGHKDWVLFAKVIDKLCFVVFAIVYICMFVGFLP